MAKYDEMKANEVRFYEDLPGEEFRPSVVSYGTVARVCSTAMENLRAQGLKIGCSSNHPLSIPL